MSYKFDIKPNNYWYDIICDKFPHNLWFCWIEIIYKRRGYRHFTLKPKRPMHECQKLFLSTLISFHPKVGILLTKILVCQIYLILVYLILLNFYAFHEFFFRLVLRHFIHPLLLQSWSAIVSILSWYTVLLNWVNFVTLRNPKKDLSSVVKSWFMS